MTGFKPGLVVLTGLGLAALGGAAALSQHHSQPANATYYPVQASAAPAVPAVPAVSAVSPFGYSRPAPGVQAVPEQAPATVTPVRTYRARRVRRHYYTRHHSYVVVHRRSRKHSLEIIGGSAAGGALIGALAGGGKGAAIGALAGGGAGFAYDRLTRKKRRVVRR